MKIRNKKTNEQIFQKFCQSEGLPTPIPEYRFDENRKWRTDYFFELEGRKVALEVEGGVWGYGRHNRAAGFIGDMEKYNTLATKGILLIRVTPKELNTMKTIRLIKKALVA